MLPFFIIRAIFIAALCALLAFTGANGLSLWWAFVLTLIYGAVVSLGAINIRWNFFLPALHHGAREGRGIALTFDDGPAAHSAAILDILKTEGVPAAFFTIGKRAEAAPDIVARWHAEAHIIGNHSYSHSFRFDWKSSAAMLEEIAAVNAVIERITEKKPVLFRPPYGVTNPALARAVNRSAMTAIGWSLRSFDTTVKSEDALLARLLTRVRGGDVILLHDSVPTTAAVLTAFIRACRAKGFTFVRLDKMLDIDAYA